MKYSLNKVKQGLGELQTTLNWSVSVIKAAAAVGEMAENLEIRVHTAGIPNAEVTETEIELGGHTINFNGKTKKAGTVDWEFYDGTDAGVVSYFTKWMNARWSGDGNDTQGKSKLTQDLKADIMFQLLGPDDKVTQTYIMVGAMPKIKTGDEGNQNADPLNPVVSWVYDDFHITTSTTKW